MGQYVKVRLRIEMGIGAKGGREGGREGGETASKRDVGGNKRH